MCRVCVCKTKCLIFIWIELSYLCWRKLSCRLKYFPQTSHENVTSGLLWVRSWIIKLYDFVNRLWQYLQMNSHFGRILRRKSDRQSSLSIRIIANIVALSGWRVFDADEHFCENNKCGTERTHGEDERESNEPPDQQVKWMSSTPRVCVCVCFISFWDANET